MFSPLCVYIFNTCSLLHIRPRSLSDVYEWQAIALRKSTLSSGADPGILEKGGGGWSGSPKRQVWKIFQTDKPKMSSQGLKAVGNDRGACIPKQGQVTHQMGGR